MYKSMKMDYDMGIMPKEVIPKFLELQEEYKLINVKPPSEFYKPWTAFWQIRNTLFHDRPISFVDIDAYNNVMKADLHHIEVKLILDFDRMYYMASDYSGNQ